MSDFSIIIPTYNRKAFLERTIQSVLGQTKAPLEIIVVDDGSTDGTEAFIRENFSDQVIYLHQPNKERGAARNHGASKAKGEYVYFLDSDDLLYADHLEKALAFLELHDHPQWFFQEYEHLDGNKKKPISFDRDNPVKTLLQKGNFMSCHGVFIRRDVFSENGFNEDRDLSGSEDYELWVRLAAQYPLIINPVITSALVEHSERSVLNFEVSKLVKRKQKMLDLIKSNTQIKIAFHHYFSALDSHTYSYIALHAVLVGEKRIGLDYLKESVSVYPQSIWSKRFMAIVKHLIK